jgi:signal transduction histidine kinase
MAVRLDATVGELREARTQAEEALSMRQQLVANISHELRTPLAILRAHLEGLLARNPVPAGTGPGEGAEVVVSAATLHALQSETERLESLVDDLFALSRAQAGALQLQREPVDVAALVDEVAALMRPLVQRDHAVALSVEAQPGLPYALADADRLRQILANLVRNAVRHTPDGGIIALSVVAEVDWLIVAVADTGEGVPPEHLPHLFDRFYRVDEARSRSSGGTGLGLAIVREFVELMDGRVTVESTPGEGTCFRVFLPRATRWEGSGPAPRA